MSLFANGDGKALYYEPEDGVTILFVEGARSQQEGAAIEREIRRGVDLALNRRGKQFVIMTVPPTLRLTCVRGRRFEFERLPDNRIRMEVKGTPKGEGLLLPGRDFKA